MFDFFGLSQELKDQIYRNLLDITVKLPFLEGLHMQVENAPSTNLLLVSHQFSDEYLGEARRWTALVCTDTGRQLSDTVEGVSLPPAFHFVQRLELRIWLICNKHAHGSRKKECLAKANLDFHLDWMAQIIDMMHNPNVSILLSLHNDNVEECDTANLLRHKELVGLRGFRRLLVRKGNSEHAYGGGDRPRVVAKYDRATGHLEQIISAHAVTSKTEEDFGYSKDDMDGTEEQDVQQDGGEEGGDVEGRTADEDKVSESEA